MPKPPRGNGGPKLGAPAATPAGRRGMAELAEDERRDFEHHPVDEHTEVGSLDPSGLRSRLTEGQRVLLADLFAVVEEHAEEAA